MANALKTSSVIGSKTLVSTVTSDKTRVHDVPTVKVCANSIFREAALLMRTHNGKKQARSYSRLLHRHGSHSVYHESHHSARLPPIQVQMVEFKARREVSIPFREGAVPAEEYLNELERVVKVTFPDSARITYLGNSTWRTRLKPITFISVSATPVCDVKVYNKGNTLQIRSDQLLLDFSGLPEEFINQTIQFSLQGQLQVDARRGSQYKAGRQVYFSGAVQLNLRTSLPLLLSLLPENVVTPVGDTILDTILGAMESALVRGIIADYHSWCWTKQNMENVESSRAFRVTG